MAKKFADCFEDASFILKRSGNDARAVDNIPIPGATIDDEWVDKRIPMWVADQNFKTCPTIIEALNARANFPSFGYFGARPEFFQEICDWQSKRNGATEIEAKDITFSASVLGGVAAGLRVFATPGANVLLHAPTYIGFTGLLTRNGFNIVHSWLKKDEKGVWRMDLADMEDKIVKNQIQVFVYCSPHNPCGRVWEKKEVEDMYALLEKYDVKVVSDEIWSDIILEGHKHVAPQLINEWAKQNTISMYCISKTFNMAGIGGGYSVIYNDYWRTRWTKESALGNNAGLSVLWMHALIGAYKPEGYEYVDELCATITENAKVAYKYLTEKFDGIDVAMPEGTFMMYLECTEWLDKHGMTIDELQKKGVKYGVVWQDGRPFHAPNSIRMNLAVPTSVVEDAFERLDKYVFNA